MSSFLSIEAIISLLTLYVHMTDIMRQANTFRPAHYKAQSYLLHSHSADFNHDSQLPSSSHPHGLRAGSSGTRTNSVCVCVGFYVHVFRLCGHLHECMNVCGAAANFAPCNPEQPLWSGSLVQNDGCPCRTNLKYYMRGHKVLLWLYV